MQAGAVMSTSKKWQLFACLVLFVLGLDQATKLYVHTTFALHESHPVIANVFAFTYVRNAGAAFGLLARVIDFLDVHWYAYHWPAFNVADSSICIGVGLLLLDSFNERPRDARELQ